jgi:hypothetical protein
MKNTINLLLRYIYANIPAEILNEAFLPTRENRSLDVLIKEKVIIDYVLQQCNIYAGRTKKIRLLESYVMRLDDPDTSDFLVGRYSVYKIPPEARENRAINAILDVSYPSHVSHLISSVDSNFISGKSVASSASTLLSSFTRVPSPVTPTATLIDGHAGIIRLDPPMSATSEWLLSCMLEYDRNFSNIGLNLIPQLQKMTLHATKAYIYNELVVKLSHGRIVSGSLLEAITSVTDQYIDSEEKFQEALMKFRGASMFSKESLSELISLMM